MPAKSFTSRGGFCASGMTSAAIAENDAYAGGGVSLQCLGNIENVVVYGLAEVGLQWCQHVFPYAIAVDIQLIIALRSNKRPGFPHRLLL